MMGFGMILMMGFWLIILVLLIGAVASALGWRPRFNTTRSTPTSPTPLAILKARYARGEISRDEYDQIHHDLEG
jgi:putative membrane protein